ncbi:glycosyltransferase [Saccharospirillum salsuginis]|uniref:Glycosyl transferase n=1 Tax=Saccharospirillum salsuginis TaxID=418750 RepID=A0A918N788_9GAMM|nr:glycosyltransferase [Saccharospirillum salsuginis]GGX49592.1 glycosyl transferase [Saccharospirillum salsuginis]
MTRHPQPLRILHLTFNMDIGGTEQVISQLVTHLDPDRYQCSVLCIDGEIGRLGERLENRGVPVASLERRPGLDWELIKALRKRIRDDGIHLVHCHQYTPYTYGWFATRFLGVPLVFTEHGRFHPDQYRTKAALINPIMALTTQAVTAISSATKAALRRYEFIPGFKVQVIYNGIEGLKSVKDEQDRLRRELGIGRDQPVVGTVARLDKVKNQSMMIRAFKAIKTQHPDVCLLLVGDGPERVTLEQLVQELDLSSDVIFTGFIVEPKAYLALMDIFLLSSFTEGTSMTLLEAMSLAIPAVATDVGGNPEVVVDGQTGRIVENNDASAFARAMDELLTYSEERHRLGKNALDRFKQEYSVDRMVDRFAALYQSIGRKEV